jgi:hypothetical protein
MRWFWVSAVDAEKWLGTACVEAKDELEAARVFHDRLCQDATRFLVGDIQDPPALAKYRLITSREAMQVLFSHCEEVEV